MTAGVRQDDNKLRILCENGLLFWLCERMEKIKLTNDDDLCALTTLGTSAIMYAVLYMHTG